ncbi:Atxe2 family lasso peptide isopeptidase [Asticcacaulis sp. W401b]|uniref:Atxe2 family lasso peptide isopeptidase n=1 Tax=Asticcacaulis sp. W401b TaxID=3388666 RepID=UPI0039707223
MAVSTQATEKRALATEDLVKLRDIGPLGVGRPDAPILALSPDGTKVAFQMRRADLARNTYCIGIVVASVDGRQSPRLVDEGGEFIKARTGGEGYVPREAGFAEVVRPVWARDGRSVYYLRRDAGRTRVWRASLDGQPATPVSPSGYDVEQFDLAPDGGSLVFRPVVSTDGSEVAEDRSGYLIDDRFNPAVSLKPLARNREPAAVLALNFPTGALRTADVADRAGTLFAPPHPEASSAIRALSYSSDRWVRVAAQTAGSLTGPKRLAAEIAERTFVCERCEWAYGLWWSEDGRDVFYFQKDRSGLGLSLYRWTPGHEAPVRLFESDDSWVGCQSTGKQLVCAREGAVSPRTLARIDLNNGRIDTFFDPNPEFSTIQLGPVQSLRWENGMGIETVGRLVLPPGYTGDSRLPLVVVGYDARGFLRGGTGDDYPVQLFAAHGFAILVYSRPPLYGAVKGASTGFSATQYGHEGWSDYRNVLSSIETGVDQLVRARIVDASRVGLTGFSNGASVAQFAMVNSHKFQAFALSHCCEDPVASLSTTGFVVNRWLRRIGYPAMTDTQRSANWQDMSIRLNAAQLSSPLLVQLSDDEYLGAIEGLTALKELEQPVEAYLFEGEHHVKWQPAHRAALYERSSDWFRFWLKGEVDPEPSKADTYDRWRGLLTKVKR